MTMDLGAVQYNEMSHLRLLPFNSSRSVRRALLALRITDRRQLVPFTTTQIERLSFDKFFTEFVDLEGKFLDLSWLRQICPSAYKSRADLSLCP
jgi:hypothetical protein